MASVVSGYTGSYIDCFEQWLRILSLLVGIAGGCVMIASLIHHWNKFRIIEIQKQFKRDSLASSEKEPGETETP